MLNYSYHNRVLGNKYKHNIIRSARRTGRTWLAMQWLLENANERVVFISAYARNTQLFVGMLQDMYPGLVRVHNQNHMALANGTTVHFVSGELTEPLIGVRATKVIVDDAGYVNINLAPIINSITNENGRSLILASGVKNDSLFQYYEKYPLRDAYYEEYSYQDALKDEVYDDSFVNEMKKGHSEVAFKNEYGPWDTIERYNKSKNKDYLHLLKK